MKIPRVTLIRIEYEDGSLDEARPLPNASIPLYALCRARGKEKAEDRRAYTAPAMAALLALTASSARRADYSLADPTIRRLLKAL